MIVSVSDFRSAFGRAPALAWRAPGRVNLIGEHTDYNGGFVLPIALQLGVRVLVAPRDDQRLRLLSAQNPSEPIVVDLRAARPGGVPGWPAYAAGVAWVLIQRGVEIRGADIFVDGSLPSGAGLSSSAALECAIAGALLALAGTNMTPRDVALVAQEAENEFVGVPCGLMDQLASTMGEAGHALFVDTRSLAVEPVPFDQNSRELELLVVDTRVRHRLLDGGYAQRRTSCERAANLLGVESLRDLGLADLEAATKVLSDDVLARRVRHVVTENQRVLDVVALMRHGRVGDIGPILAASHASLRDDYEVSCTELDLAVDVAMSVGAYGARMTGAGFGGSAIALVDRALVADLRAKVVRAFDRAHLRSPAIFNAVASAGAGPDFL